jgi:molybdate transport system substrate-binding protein
MAHSREGSGVIGGLHYSAGRVAAVVAVVTAAAVIFISSCGGTSVPSGGQSSSDASSLLVAAAADLSPVLAELTPVFEKESGLTLKTNIGSTGQLTQQIAAGAPVDLFLAASTSAIDQLAQENVLVPGTSQIYATGRLVMWTRPGSKLSPKTLQDLTSPEVHRISIANPDHAPYGQAAKQALQSAGLWDTLQPKLVPAENVLQAFQFAGTGNVDVGFVALSLVATVKGTYVLVPDTLHKPINQELAVIASSTHQDEAKRFIAFLTGSKGREIMKKYGFVLPDEK